MNRLSKLIYIVAVSLLMLAPRWVEAGPPQTLKPDELEALLEKAETAEDHLKLAAHYSAEAERLSKDAERHAGLAVRYRRRGSLPPKIAAAFQGMPKHCENLAQSLRNAAKGAQQLAESHKGMADELKK